MQVLDFTCQYKYFGNTVGKGEVARKKEQFLLFPQCFLPFFNQLPDDNF